MASVSAAPNRILLHGQVIRFDKRVDSKIYLRVKVEGFECLSGPCFAEKGQEVNCFTFLEASHLSPGASVKAEAEYIGGPHQGSYQLLKFIND